MAALKISVLGPLQVSAETPIHQKFESNKVRALFAYLVVERDRPHSREGFAEMLWPEGAAQSGLANLRYALADLRRVIGDDEARPPYLIVSRAGRRTTLPRWCCSMPARRRTTSQEPCCPWTGDT